MGRDVASRIRATLVVFMVCSALGAQATRGGTTGTSQRTRLGLAPLAEQADRPSLGFGFRPRPSDGILPTCMEVVQVVAGSPAEQAGIRVGDLIMAVNDQPVPLIQDLLNGLSRPGPAILKIRRGGAELTVRILVPQPDPMGSGASLFAVPGVKRPAQSGRGINTLRTVFIDPRTGSAAFIGTYDAAYGTGPIDYEALLQDALRSPYPAFSLDPSPATKAARQT
ncbi:MAG TPA: PDZ domain-containing protein, partial [Holophaga sp.]|nr:PDZ domain-containing protein [Holophaga sp.]